MGSQRHRDEAEGTEMMPGVVRRTLAYNDDVMLCEFRLEKGAKIPLHNHPPSQIGYLMSGRVRFIGANPEDGFEATPGQAYVIDSDVQHGAEALESSVFVEVFSPAREEYRDF